MNCRTPRPLSHGISRAIGSVYEDSIEGKFIGKGYEITLISARRPMGGEVIYHPNSDVLELILDKDCELKASNNHSLSLPKFQNVQGVTFLPRDMPVKCCWTAGSQRTVHCDINFDYLLQDCFHEDDFADIRKDLCINMYNPYLATGLRRIAEELISPSFVSSLQIDLVVKSMALELLGYFNNRGSSYSRRQDTEAHLMVQKLHTYVESCDKIPSIEDIASVCGISSRRLSTLYRNSTGSTLRTYLASIKIQRAQSLLSRTNLLIKQVAYACDFTNVAAFVAAFKKATGMTPLEFRQSI